jgi:SnoaL-like domain
MDSTSESLQTLLDERAIRRCILRYCHGTDRHDWHMVQECYLPGAVDNHGSFNGTPENLADWLESNSQKRGAKQHFIANQTIEIAGDSAVCESYYLCYIEFIDDPECEDDGAASAVVMGGRYVDWLSRYEDDWRIAHRTVLLDWSRDLGPPRPWSAPEAAAYARGRHDRKDPAMLGLAEVVQLRTALGSNVGETVP